MAVAPTTLTALGQALGQIIVGQTALIEPLLVAALVGGHVVLEGVPGTGKTLLVKALAQLLGAEFRRVQLTPDILPADILGTSIFDPQACSFSFRPGPIFTEVLLADEVNRTPPRTQAALLEAMQEQQVTLEGQTRPLPPFFWVIATQNPLEFEGTYPLPEAQLDRFLFKLTVDYPDYEAEKTLLRADLGAAPLPQPLLKPADLVALRPAVAALTATDVLIEYLLALVHHTRQHRDLLLGASPRAAVAWLQAGRARAWMAGRDYVTPDDLQVLALPLLQHRLILKPEAQLEGVQLSELIQQLVEQVPVPR
ncbi:MAG: MoxR family ATPase [Gloeomargaritaceae cyanobacterium C42_A2020_066]|nr:MoxR family ATPase [Gloeomargaritaceae cyanobacterium C42_A2020_066]